MISSRAGDSLVGELEIGELAEVSQRGSFFGAARAGGGQFFAHGVGLAAAELEEAIGAGSGRDEALFERRLTFGVGHSGGARRDHHEGQD
jgi:hypothetical protein